MSLQLSSPRVSLIKRPVGAIILIVACYIIFGLLIGLGGEFPLNDDWAYVNSVRNFVFTGYWRRQSGLSPSLLTQSLWGASFCYTFGCTFETLRLSSFVATLVTTFISFFLFRRTGASQNVILLALTSIVFNPILYTLSFTYMTDPFFIMATLISVYLFLISLEEGSCTCSRRRLRQPPWLYCVARSGYVVPAAYAIVRFLRPGEERILRRSGSLRDLSLYVD